MFKVKGHTPAKRYGRDDIKPCVEIWEQPLKWWLIARFYHYVWEKRTWKLLRKIEPWHESNFGQNDDFYIPLTNRQDLRCADLRDRKKKHLAYIMITNEEYDRITGNVPPKGDTQEPLSFDDAT